MKGLLSKKVVVCFAAALLVVAAWGFRQVVPAGLRLRSVEPFYFWSRDLGTFTSPEGANEVRVLVNDAGAMHSGNHWAWVITSSAVWGRRIVAEGYVDSAEARGDSLPLRWLSEDEIEVTFRQGRRASMKVVRVYSIR